MHGFNFIKYKNIYILESLNSSVHWWEHATEKSHQSKQRPIRVWTPSVVLEQREWRDELTRRKNLHDWWDCEKSKREEVFLVASLWAHRFLCELWEAGNVLHQEERQIKQWMWKRSKNLYGRHTIFTPAHKNNPMLYSQHLNKMINLLLSEATHGSVTTKRKY